MGYAGHSHWLVLAVSVAAAGPASAACSDTDSTAAPGAGGASGSAGTGGSGGTAGGSAGSGGLGGGASGSSGSAGVGGGAGSSGTAWQFFAFGDTRTNPDIAEENVRSMYALDPAAVAAFNGGDLTATAVLSQWDAHHKALADGAPDPSVPADPSGIVRQSRFRTDVANFGPYVRYVGIFGNHDDGTTDWLNNWNAYMSGQSKLGENGTDGIYFSLNYKNALFVVLDSIRSSSAQTTWLQATLTGTQAASAKFKFVFFHRPIYPCNGKSPFDAGLEWVELFEKHGVDVAFVADSHTYERTCPMLGGDCAPGGVVYLNTSGGGAPVRAVYATKTDTVSHGGRSDAYDCAKILNASRGFWYHFVHIQMTDCKATLSAYPHDHSDVGGPPLDTFSLDKCG